MASIILGYHREFENLGIKLTLEDTDLQKTDPEILDSKDY